MFSISFQKSIVFVIAVIGFLAFLKLQATPIASGDVKSSSFARYHAEGSTIVDANGKEAHFNGISWFGFETHNFSPHGLWQRSLEEFLDGIRDHGYNLIRLPFSNEMLHATAPNSINYYKNPSLQGLTPLQLLDKVITEAKKRGIMIYLDRHRPTSEGQSELWYTARVSEDEWIDDWQMLALRYLKCDNVIGADLHNEPHGRASWGSGDVATDWRLAAERCGNAILNVNPHWLIIVEGVETNVQGHPGNYWWGGNLSGAKEHPVRLDMPQQLVYSPHDYGPGVYQQPWFKDSSFPHNLQALWDLHWGYLHKEGIAPVLVGEFGGRDVSWNTPEGIWQNFLVDYIAANKIYWTYWCMNPNSGDTGGLLLDDWITWNRIKQEMLLRLY